jgi:hypothetical protein
MESRASHMLGKCSTSEVHLQPRVITKTYLNFKDDKMKNMCTWESMKYVVLQ